MTTSYTIFDRRRVRQHRDRAAEGFGRSDFLLREMAARLSERLDDLTQRFPLALDLGSHTGLLAEYIGGKAGIERLVQADLSPAMLREAKGWRVAADEEWLPFAPERFDLVISAGSLHWVNDLPGALIQVRHILKPGGLFLAILPGGETLKELRHAFEQAEFAVSAGLSPRVSPFIDVRDAGALLQRAGFESPVADTDRLTVSYESPLRLLEDLRAMGEANALAAGRKSWTRRSLIFKAMDVYEAHFIDDSGRAAATFELVTLTGWKPRAGR